MTVITALPSLSLYHPSRAKQDDQDTRSKTKLRVPDTDVHADGESFPSVSESTAPDSTVSGKHTPHSRGVAVSAQSSGQEGCDEACCIASLDGMHS